MTKYTMGGLEEKDALQWNDKTYKEFGSIVVRLDANDRETRIKAREDFYEFRRYFFLNDWNPYYIQVEEMRKEKGFDSIAYMLDETRKLVVGEKLEEIEKPIHQTKQEESEMSEQKVITLSSKMVAIFAASLADLAEKLKDLAELTEVAKEAPAPTAKIEEKKAAAEAPKAEPVEEVAEGEISYQALRDSCKTKVLALAQKNKAKAVEILASFSAKKLPEVKDEDLQLFEKALDEALV